MDASRHQKAINAAKKLLRESILEHEAKLPERFHRFDEELMKVARELSRDVMEEVGNEIAGQEEAKCKEQGLTAQRRTDTPFLPCSDPSK